MKRFFYTTAAVVAFAFSGMANTIEVESLTLKEEVNKTYVEESKTPCADGAKLVRGIATLVGIRDQEVLNDMFWNFFNDCMEALYGDWDAITFE